MARILIVTQNFYPEIGSAANRMKNLFLQFKKNGYDVHVFTTEPSYPNKKLYKDAKFFNEKFIDDLEGISITRIKMRHEKHKDSFNSRLYYYTEFMLKVHYFVKKTNHIFDYVYITSPNIFTAWGALFFQKHKCFNTILEIRDLWPDSVEAIDKVNISFCLPILKLLEMKMYNNANKIVVNNTNFISHIQKMMIKKKPIIYIPNAVNKEEVHFRTPYDEFSVVYTGNIGLAQNVDQLIEIAEKLNEEKIHFNTIIYGINAKVFRKYVSDHQLKYVHVHDPMTRNECLNFMSKNHLSLSILKDTEVFLNVMPGKVVDAICTHVPVITNLGGDTNKLINNEKIGFAKESATTEELMEAILYFRSNSEILNEYKENTRRVKNRDFLWENNIKKLISFIEA
ncbi:glycosyltransferase family 4 protein [Macrococcus sp. DPC7161]|uniref:glycosyltransferase family 4 protein n=1 Tax=Macrococcus sp. DPC7161 TaxID=2507060 RepID=UPI00100BC55B|nr:glycosyltransferase family 4 protein [Macrococcus sp. DPC7161]RXK18807.1 glycosyltransferase WbuB [Macrococcus sp. DPC7161]